MGTAREGNLPRHGGTIVAKTSCHGHNEALRGFAACNRFFYASSACIYPEGRQLETEVEGGGLKEEHAWPAQVRLEDLVQGCRIQDLCMRMATEHLPWTLKNFT